MSFKLVCLALVANCGGAWVACSGLLWLAAAMIILSEEHPIIKQAVLDQLQSEKRDAVTVATIADFDGSTYHIMCGTAASPDAKNSACADHSAAATAAAAACAAAAAAAAAVAAAAAAAAGTGKGRVGAAPV